MSLKKLFKMFLLSVHKMANLSIFITKCLYFLSFWFFDALIIFLIIGGRGVDFDLVAASITVYSRYSRYGCMHARVRGLVRVGGLVPFVRHPRG